MILELMSLKQAAKAIWPDCEGATFTEKVNT